MKTLREDLDIRLNDLFTKILNKNIEWSIATIIAVKLSVKREII